MVDVSSGGAAFTCYADHACPYPGQRITARFSIPRYGTDRSFDMADFTRSGNVLRVDPLNSNLRRVAVQFVEPLPFRPAEQSHAELEPASSLQ